MKTIDGRWSVHILAFVFIVAIHETSFVTTAIAESPDLLLAMDDEGRLVWLDQWNGSTSVADNHIAVDTDGGLALADRWSFPPNDESGGNDADNDNDDSGCGC